MKPHAVLCAVKLSSKLGKQTTKGCCRKFNSNIVISAEKNIHLNLFLFFMECEQVYEILSFKKLCK